jgi:hypothetical protein
VDGWLTVTLWIPETSSKSCTPPGGRERHHMQSSFPARAS